ncbi:hypothetical protein QUF80_23100 [Desulfococcaceae bacterium HSG8]|nr:hypothetical protein [Desulfococcaceae bacterium HSG8]
MNNNPARLFFYILLLVLLTGCTNPGSNEEVLKQKVQKQWDARLKSDWGVVYDMTTDSYKKLIDRNSFIRKANIQVAEFSIKEVKILKPGKEASASVDCTTIQMGFKFNRTIKEKWLWENGGWHLYLPPATVSGPFRKPKT